MKRIFPNIEEYYSDNEIRRRSGEADYGVWWRSQHTDWPRYRISYVQTTGEVYILEQSGNDRVNSEDSGLVIILAVVPPDYDCRFDDGECGPAMAGRDRSRCHHVYSRTLETILDGWGHKCMTPDGVERVKERLAAYAP